MKKHRLRIKFCLLLIAILILLPVVLTFLYSFFAPAEIKSFMETRSQYGDSLMEIKEASRTYTTFSGAPMDMDSSVRFIIKTDGIEAEED